MKTGKMNKDYHFLAGCVAQYRQNTREFLQNSNWRTGCFGSKLQDIKKGKK
jgi:hypothetical protein